MNLQILEEAEVEFTDAIARYQSIELGLGVRLKEEVKSTLAWIADHPESPRIRSLGYRRINLKVFPITSPTPSMPTPFGFWQSLIPPDAPSIGSAVQFPAKSGPQLRHPGTASL